jgi:chromatin segregation and condensation protein Rec8/ScpA/Scc1 (kleisin family)
VSLRKEKPYYLRQPWDILFRENKLEKVSPWSVDLVQLLASLLEEMEREGIDFRIAGTAINSSVLIYLKKAEMLLEFNEPPQPLVERGDIYVPPPVPLPFRFEFTTTSVQDLIKALEKALEEEGSRGDRPKLPLLPIPVPNFLDVDQYLLEVETRADDLLEEIRKSHEAGRKMRILDLIEGLSWFETVRVFMMLLFLAQKEEIDLIQDEDETDILIVLREVDMR